MGESSKPRYVRVDGFSRRPDSQAVVPDFLFFGAEEEVDLSKDYGDKKFKKVRIRGLIETLNRYKFTIEENTPIEQDVALDPELCGKIFENLLAAYNPETGATARKQTGSFYTPREIVDYMVDEALVAHLTPVILTPALSKGEGAGVYPSLGGDQGEVVTPSFGGDKGEVVSPSFGGGRGEVGWKTTDAATYGAVKDFTLQHRRNQTEAESVLWQRLRNRQLGAKFRRQHPIDKYIADFVCLERKLVIEADGEIHEKQKEADAQRDRDLLAKGYRTIRFANREILRNTDNVIHGIEHHLASSPPSEGIKGRSSPPPSEGVGGGFEGRLRHLLSWEETSHDFSDDEVDALIDRIDSLKAIDPAVGSGAFPMGILHKLVFILGKLDPGNERWKAKQIARMEDAVMREEAERVFRDNEDNYGRKLYLIENCIYGVDIQSIAVQIAKMRFFISLIVDQNVDPAKPNLGVRALPNLETKFVAANTLIGIEKPDQKMFRNPRIDDKEAELRTVREKHFNARTLASKAKYREQDKKLRGEIADLLKSDGWNDKTAKQLAAWDPYDQNASAPFFDPEWMFGIGSPSSGGGWGEVASPSFGGGRGEVGFDIVIGNPPYVRQEAIKDQKAAFQTYECFTGTADLYVYFYERGVKILKNGGILSFISSNKWYRAAYGEKLRAWLAERTGIIRMIDFGDAPVFTAIAYPTIVITRRGRFPSPGGDRGEVSAPSFGGGQGEVASPSSGGGWGEVSTLTWNPDWPLEEFNLRVKTDSQSMSQRDLKPDGWRLESPVKLRLLDKLRKAGTPLGEYVKGRFYRGILTGLNEAFVVDRATRDRLIAENASSAEVLKPFLRGRDVKRWRVEYAEQYLIKIESSENKEHAWSGKPEKEAEKVFSKTYPAIHAFFGGMRKDLIKRYDQGKYFWELRSCDYWQEFEQAKIVYQEIATYQAFAWDGSGAYTNNKTFLIPETSKFLLAILNSATCWWFLGQIASKLQGGAYAMQTPYVGAIPIPAATPARQAELERLVTRILSAKKADPSSDVSPLEREIDQIVYRLYALTPEEIKIVEGMNG